MTLQDNSENLKLLRNNVLIIEKMRFDMYKTTLNHLLEKVNN